MTDISSDVIIDTTASGRTFKYYKIGDQYYADYLFKRFDPTPCLTELPHMKGRQDDVLLCGCHRCGTNWLWEILCMLVYETLEYQPGRKVPSILEFQTQEHFRNMTSPRVLSSHLKFENLPGDLINNKCKIIYLQRNPKDVAVSFYHHMNDEMEANVTWEEYLDMFLNAREDNYTFWLGTAKSWSRAMKEYPNYPILLVNFEDLKKDPVQEIKRMTNFLNIQRDPRFISDVAEKINFNKMKTAKLETIKQINQNNLDDSAQKMINKCEKYYRKGEVGDWKNLFTVAQNEHFDKTLDKRMPGLTSTFVYSI